MIPLSEKYINTVQIKQLLKKIPALKGLLGNLRVELELVIIKGREGIVGTDEQVMYAMAMAAQVLSSMPHCETEPGAKATRIVAKHEDIADKQYQQVKQDLTAEVITISTVIEKTQYALSGLKDEWKTLLVDHFIERRTWAQVADKISVTSKYLKEIMVIEALNGMQALLKVNVADFEFCLKKLEQEGEKEV